MRMLLVTLFAAAALTASAAPRAQALEARQSVYVNLADSLQGSLDDLTGALRGAFVADGWEVVAVHEVATDRAD